MQRFTVLFWALLVALVCSAAASGQEDDPFLASETFEGLELRGIGPALMSGRIADIAIHPHHQSIWYIAAGSGGVWKTINSGTTWTPIFDDQSSYSIGCVALDPKTPEVVWVGTGENVSGRHVGYGDGVYKSLDGGKSWTRTGLEKSEHIGRILVDPRDSDVVYVAAEGPLWKAGGDRGVFKTTDGGKTWDAVLEISEDTGVTDLELDPRNPHVIYAAAYQRRRHIWALLAGGPESGIYKTSNGGESWRRLSNGLPEEPMGRIGLAVSPVNPDIVYATIEADDDSKGFYRSENAGESWEKRSDTISGGTGPHYYQEIYASPHKLDRVYQMDVWLQVTEDGGKTFQRLGETYKHSDNHALAFDPDDPDYLLAGCDGGLYETWDHGGSWKFVANLPLTQFYKVALDNDTPSYNIAGGTQDNNAQVGPSRTTNRQGIRNDDWYITVSGDGYACQIDPEDPNIIYSEWQYGGLTRFDRRSGELVDIQPQPRRGDPPERWNWDSPVLISPHSHTRLYFGSQRLWRSDDRGDSWMPISGDLSRGRNRYEMEIMGRVWSVDALYDNGAMSWYGNLTAISESPLQEGLIYVGTDDGLIVVTEDGGQNWRRNESFSGVPDLSFVNEVKASLHDVGTVFAVLDNHKVGDFKPYVLKSHDRGRTWSSISGDLPDRHIVWSVVQDHVEPDLLFAGTEFGIFFTADGGTHWVKLEGGVPTIAFRDLEIQRRENDLVGASFGRGFYVLDDYTPLRHFHSNSRQEEATLFPVKDAWLFVPSVPLGLREKANLGDAYFAAPNPPSGAVFTYFLRDSLETSKESRKKSERELNEKGEDVRFPGWEALEKEDREYEPAIVLIVEDEVGNVVRRLSGPTTKGFQRVAWDLCYPPSTPTELKPPVPESLWEEPPAGPMVSPGRYTVRLSKLVDGELTLLGEPQTFQVVALENSTLPVRDRKEISAFQKATGELQRRARSVEKGIDEALERLEYIKKTIVETPGVDAGLLPRARAIELGLKDAQKQITGDPTLRRFSEPRVPSVLDRVSQIVAGHWKTTYGPTETHRQSYQVALAELEEASERVRQLIETDLEELEEALEAGGAPWTPGRKIP